MGSKVNSFTCFILLVLIYSIVFSNDFNLRYNQNNHESLGKIGTYDFPGNPLSDRAKGYILDGKIKSAILNYGNFIDWSQFPTGLWGRYAYLPHISFLAGVPGHVYSSKFNWQQYTYSSDYIVWISNDAYEEWFSDLSEEKFKGIVFNMENDKGDLCYKIESENQIEDFENEQCLWFVSDDNYSINIHMSINQELDPNLSSSRIGLIYPWALRPALKKRYTDFYDEFDYGDDLEEWTEDDNYMFYGSTVSESWFSEGLSDYTDWQPKENARFESYNGDINTNDIFKDAYIFDAPLINSNDTYPVLAHSKYSETWPKKINPSTGRYEQFWPGWWKKQYIGDSPELLSDNEISNCSNNRKDEDCWIDKEGEFISDNDIYMEFDDRWAERGNIVNDNVYMQTGYPLGLSVKATAHSYGVKFAEDIMFVTVKVRNESGDWIDEDGNFNEGLIMPDGTKLNQGKGFNYKDVSLGFYFDSIIIWADYSGNTSYFTNTDDYMEYYWDRIYHEGDSLLISLAMTYDYDFNSNGATDIGIAAAQLLDTPLATKDVDLNQDGIVDIYEGEPLKITDWHWFDWYNRPGVVSRESNTNCCAGWPNRAQAANKEAIQYKLMVGDTTNLSSNEKEWFFHTADPSTDSDLLLNPHFDSLDGLQNEPVFNQGPEGFDCIFIMSCGPFDLDVGEEVPFSFCILFGENKEDLIKNAEFAQLMYNSNYQSFTAPSSPIVNYEYTEDQVKLIWDDSPLDSEDGLTGYTDFEGFRIYKSIDGGQTWGDRKIYNFDTGLFYDWEPYAQFDLSSRQDSMFCVKGKDENGNCINNEIRNIDIQGKDPNASWVNLGQNSGMPEKNENGFYFFTDNDVVSGTEYTYSITSYDMGIRSRDSIFTQDLNGYYIYKIQESANPDNWAWPDGYKSLESAKGTSTIDKNYIKIIPGYKSSESNNQIKVVPNPFIVRSGFNTEGQYLRRLRFTNLPEKCSITIFTISGEKVIKINHDSLDGNEWWDLRTINNQEVAPGIYFYSIKSKKQVWTGKFAVIM